MSSTNEIMAASAKACACKHQSHNPRPTDTELVSDGQKTFQQRLSPEASIRCQSACVRQILAARLSPPNYVHRNSPPREGSERQYETSTAARACERRYHRGNLHRILDNSCSRAPCRLSVSLGWRLLKRFIAGTSLLSLYMYRTLHLLS